MSTDSPIWITDETMDWAVTVARRAFRETSAGAVVRDGSDPMRAALEAALPILLAEITEGIGQAIDRLTVSEATRNHPYPIDAATAEAAAIARNYGKETT